ncbi:multiple sugar transport system substrate-binding protein [Austwickia chelonae]|uniref:Putative ABC transporter substrate-binding protein n=1 Tax=Austwickia chelonae NBRC 105200 TaxID=1184607 RepID=K6VTN7_9MICO|nr:sugar ABC transporter substrate-binding protein [Austwickia chelonae]GAB78700.1 putative ABC transporter substrate-binding protein [Austwickia chelonae NBRC 105200]SEW34829.1 multiple sugar transport system substrate-binding protein [Austwickia chelonae]
MGPSSLRRLTMTRRRLLTLTGGMMIAGAVGACGDANQTERVGRTAGHPGPSLTQWFHQYGEQGTRQAMERYATTYPAAEVSTVWKGDEYDTSVVTALYLNDAPDVFEYGSGPTIDLVKSGQVADLTDLFGGLKGDFHSQILERMIYQGKIWAVPQVLDMQLLVYRKSMLQKSGVEPPRTMDALLSAAEKTTSGKVKGLFIGNDAGAGLMGGPMLRSAGLDLLSRDGQIAFDDPKAAEAVSLLRKLYTSGSLLTGAKKDWWSPEAFTQGLTAMQFTGLWNLPELLRSLGDDFGVLPWPAMDGGHDNVVVSAYGACVNARGKNVEAAKKYVKWLWVEQEAKQIDWATSYGLHIPARNSVAEKSEKLRTGPAQEAVRLAKEKGYVQRHILWSRRCQTSFHDMMTRVIREGSPAEKELDSVKKIVDAELKRVAD